MRTEAEITADAIEAGLTNPDGSAITTEEQLAAAKELAAAEAEQPAEEVPAPEEDVLLRTALSILKPDEVEPVEAAAAPDHEAEKESNLATLKEWGVEMPADATAEAIAAKVAEGKPGAAAPAAPVVVDVKTAREWLKANVEDPDNKLAGKSDAEVLELHRVGQSALAKAAPPKPAKKKKFSVVPAEHAETVETAAAPVATPIPAAATPPPASADPDEVYVKTLTDDQQEELHEAAVAEMLEPVKYKGQRKKLIDFFRQFETTARDVQAREPEANLEQNETIKALAAKKPNLTVSDQKRVLRKIGADEGKNATLAEVNPQLMEMRQTQRRIELEPKFQNFAQNVFKTGVHTLIVSDAQSPVADAVKVIMAKGVEEARKDYPLEAKVYEQEMPRATRRIEQFLLLKNEAVTYNREKPDPDHLYVVQFVEREGQDVAEYEAKNGRVVDRARTFLPRSEFIKMLNNNPAEAATYNAKEWKTKSYCTFTDLAIVDMLAKNAKNIMDHRVKFALEEGEKMGFERRGKSKLPSTPTTPPKPAKEIVPPRAVPSAIRPPKPAVPAAQPEGVDVVGTMYSHHTKR